MKAGSRQRSILFTSDRLELSGTLELRLEAAAREWNQLEDRKVAL